MLFDKGKNETGRFVAISDVVLFFMIYVQTNIEKHLDG